MIDRRWTDDKGRREREEGVMMEQMCLPPVTSWLPCLHQSVLVSQEFPNS